MSDRMEVFILGRSIGTADGWDGDPGECGIFYDFVPFDGVALPKGDLHLDEQNGWIGMKYNDSGDVIDQGKDLPTFLAAIPRK